MSLFTFFVFLILLLTCSGWQGRWQVLHLSRTDVDRLEAQAATTLRSLTQRRRRRKINTRRGKVGNGSISGPFWLKPKWLGFEVTGDSAALVRNLALAILWYK